MSKLPTPYVDCVVQHADGSTRIARLPHNSSYWSLLTYSNCKRGYAWRVSDVVAWREISLDFPVAVGHRPDQCVATVISTSPLVLSSGGQHGLKVGDRIFTSAGADAETLALDLERVKETSKRLAELDDATIKSQADKLRELTAKLAEATALLSGWVDCVTEDELNDLNEKSAEFVREKGVAACPTA